MPKQKTHKAGAKRYRVTGTGKLMRRQANRNHINTKMRSKTKRALDAPAPVAEADTAKIQLELPYMKYARR